MCTSLMLKNQHSLFGRNLDLDYPFDSQIIIAPKNYEFKFRHQKSIKAHYAIIGMGIIIDNYPLYADACNEHGLAIAGLKFKDFSHYFKKQNGKTNIASFEIIPFILSQARNCKEALKILSNMNITNESFDTKTPHTQLHWMISDKTSSYVIESTKEGLNIYKNLLGVLTNSPSFPFHLENIKNYLNVTSEVVESRFSKNIVLKSFSSGIGTFSLPGDLSSTSRFVKAAFLRNNLQTTNNLIENIIDFFRILDNVSFVSGAAKTENDIYEITQYSTCYDLKEGTVYYKTYYNNEINAVKLEKRNAVGNELLHYSLIKTPHFNFQN